MSKNLKLEKRHTEGLCLPYEIRLRFLSEKTPLIHQRYDSIGQLLVNKELFMHDLIIQNELCLYHAVGNSQTQCAFSHRSDV